MIPQIDLFHILEYQSPEGFVAISDYTEQPVEHTDVYTPDGIWCGATTATQVRSSLIAAIRSIIKYRINWEKHQPKK